VRRLDIVVFRSSGSGTGPRLGHRVRLGRFGSIIATLVATPLAIGLVAAALVLGYFIAGLLLAVFALAILLAMVRSALRALRR